MIVSERNVNESARDYALRIIKYNIVCLELKPGSRVNDHELAAELGLSRTPVREALIELSNVAIVQMFPQKASVIAPIDFSLMEEAYFMRENLECAVVRRCCQMADGAMLAPLYENLALQEFYLNQPLQNNRLSYLDNEFHRLLFAVAGLNLVHSLLDTFSIHFTRIAALFYRENKEREAVQMHRNLLEAIMRHDEEGSVQIMKEHLSYFQVEKEEIFNRFPQYFASK